MKKKKTLILTLVFSLLIPLTVFSIMDESGAFDTRSDAQSQLMEQFRAADIDNNGKVDLNDFDSWLEMWKGYKANKASYSRDGDIDGNGGIGISDFAMWLEQWRGYKAYAANPEAYLVEKPDGLVATWPLDEQTGTGSYIIDTISGEYQVTPVGTDVYSSGLFGSSILMGQGDSLDVRNGSELPIQNGGFIVSLWMNLLDNTMYDISLTPNAFVWDRTEYAFKVVGFDSSDINYSDLMQIFKSIDIEMLIEDGTGGWFNLIAEYENSTGIMSYYINSIPVGSYESAIANNPEANIVLSLLPENIDVAIDNIQVWEGRGGSVENVYQDSFETYSNNTDTNPQNDYYTYIYPELINQNQEEEEDEYKYYKDPNYTYTVRGYDARDCIVCSPDYDYTYVHFNLAGYDNPEGQAADESICERAIKGYGDYSIESGSEYYTCASSGRCGGIYSDYEVTVYPGDSNSINVPDYGLNTRAEYARCLEDLYNKSNKIEEEEARLKSCSACSTRYYYIIASWEGTCNEKTDAERLAVDPNLIYSCRRCGSDGTFQSACLLGGYPGSTDEIFQSHYDSNIYGSPYDTYVKNCIGDRDGCTSLIVRSSKEGCNRCSTDFQYVWATWDPGPDGVCYIDGEDYPKDDLYGSATYTCDCSCTANKRTFTGTWSGTDYSTYEDCKASCQN
jgi:hypothetical protein